MAQVKSLQFNNFPGPFFREGRFVPHFLYEESTELQQIRGGRGPIIRTSQVCFRFHTCYSI